MAADLQVFSSVSLFSLLPATVATTPLQYEHCRHPFVMAAFSLPIFSFLIACHLRAWFFAPDTEIVCYAKYMFLYEYICPQQIRVYLIHPFRCKVSYRYVDLKGRSTFRRYFGR